ncbi:hypothetical protein CDD83_3453 [Cordyceps sp. RAO-2017]|nr:hypothetical protein CDD83_3453 [Cordyceps sp. RAO-2017]
MARIAEDAAPVEYDPQDPYDAAFGMLSQMLNRMSQNILHPDSEREHRLRASEYERVRVEANLEYARSMLTKLEQDTSGTWP